ncbi:TlpA disulfide reductase family protein [Sediminibacterium sp.]|uniref:TlpA disulfide reductase family protein n=1 Tax=Sediminibacterium sp. TaxID=1917865 RepID=UPI0027355BAF|nr:TlpA disulfide reductase family protein [Sediminibacterium sp.]MDP3393641.1 TlpA disulfide reductase family protein [Sediminibacterium sp.]MDP3566586.1 TlpA disulfide reductase family protein [Sediminibacterium sp.]
MKTNFFLLLLLTFFSVSAQTGFQISGNISNTKPNMLVFLMNGTDGKTIATDTVRDGKFILKGIISEPDIFQLGFVGYKEALDIFLFNDQVTITADFNNIAAASIIGSSVETDYQQFKASFNPIRERLNYLVQQINPEKNRFKRDSLILLYEQAKGKVLQEATKFAKEKTASPVSSFVLFAISPLLNGTEDLENRYNALDPAAKKGSFARMIEQTIAEANINKIGTEALDFSQKDTLGKLVSLKSFRGKYVLIDFWASWCGPCRAENPNLVNAFNKYANKNFTVLGVSLDDNKASWMNAIRKDKLTWTQVSDLQSWNNKVAQLYKIQSIPANYLLDPSGKIIAKDLRGNELQVKLKELLQ